MGCDIKLLDELKAHYAKKVGCHLEEMIYDDVYTKLLSEEVIDNVCFIEGPRYKVHRNMVEVADKIISYIYCTFLEEGLTEEKIGFSENVRLESIQVYGTPESLVDSHREILKKCLK